MEFITRRKLKKMNSNITLCLRKVACGHFIMVVKVLMPYRVVSYHKYTIKIVAAKHPHMSHSSMSTTLFFEPPPVHETETILVYIKLFLKGTFSSRVVSRAQHILDALCRRFCCAKRSFMCNYLLTYEYEKDV